MKRRLCPVTVEGFRTGPIPQADPRQDLAHRNRELLVS